MQTLILTDQTSKIAKVSKRLSIHDDAENSFSVMVNQLNSVFIFGNIQLSTQILSLLASEGIPVYYFNFQGQLKGIFSGDFYKNIDLKYQQYQLYQDDNFKLDMAKNILIKKITNQINFIKKPRRKERLNFKNFKKAAEESIAKIKNASKDEELLGLEGALTNKYYKTISELFTGEVKFNKRSKNPPEDEANALLSFGYTILYSTLSNLSKAYGLDPYLGFYHKEDYNRNSLSCDIMEMYRPVIDRLTLKLLNKNILKKKHFNKENYFLNSDGKSKFFTEWRSLMYEKSLINSFNQTFTKLVKSIRRGEVLTFEEIHCCL